MAIDTTRFERIRQAAGSRSESDVFAFAQEHEGGVGGLLDEVFGNMPDVFRADRAKGQQADFQYVIKTPDGPHEYFVRIHDGVCESGRGQVESPQLTTTVELPTFLRLVTGRINGMQAFLRGKVKLSGNTLYAAKFEHWFERPS
ncbi:SCP2 sterol-binding domain-containing protein [Micromonospora sp. STR1_7]|uniref:SCP2 sterol-binding domain-containing protein n=1 Tax=Micromonospora parastrephiae TaxID=2806101 RepID=A0ABS1XTH5_9ACTN|nr:MULTISPECIES: SCP2 sterol-binding domain-containing protein [Micromonospora]MBM0232574.1 SCP2 sterol-binding domain-containing protein [Micromonospora parastrephiae]WBC07482.1 SCP2 sterol-binding domain-containing protein [Micromonospora sp. WMMA1947]